MLWGYNFRFFLQHSGIEQHEWGSAAFDLGRFDFLALPFGAVRVWLHVGVQLHFWAFPLQFFNAMTVNLMMHGGSNQ